MLLLFFFNDTATTEIYTLSLHDALPISSWPRLGSPACSRRRTGNGMPDSAERGMRSAELIGPWSCTGASVAVRSWRDTLRIPHSAFRIWVVGGEGEG